MITTTPRGDVTVKLSDGQKVELACTISALMQIEAEFGCGIEEAMQQTAGENGASIVAVAKFLVALTAGTNRPMTIEDVGRIRGGDLVPLIEGVGVAMSAMRAGGDEGDEVSPPGE